MRVLVLGGTQFVGRHIVECLVRAGHAVTIFNRGRTADELPLSVERLRGDRDRGTAGLDALSDRCWDVCVDVSGLTALHVRSSTEELRASVGHYVFISAVSVYGDPLQGPVDESYPLLPAAPEYTRDITAETYGPLKVACERIVEESFPGRCALLRPQIVAGPFDPYDRFSYWVRRPTQGGKVLAPGDGSDHLQFIDAQDLAEFARTVCEQSLAGAFNLSGPRLTWREFLELLGMRNMVWVPAPILRNAGLTEFELPLYRSDGGPRSSLMHVSHDRAIRAGLHLTDVRSTADRIRRWLPKASLTPALSAHREAQLLALFRNTHE